MNADEDAEAQLLAVRVEQLTDAAARLLNTGTGYAAAMIGGDAELLRALYLTAGLSIGVSLDVLRDTMPKAAAQ